MTVIAKPEIYYRLASSMSVFKELNINKDITVYSYVRDPLALMSTCQNVL